MKIIRFIALQFLKNLNFNFTIRHHYTGFKFYLNSYTHKGYWFYGKKRELNTVMLFKKLITHNNVVLEIGGHIGYFTTLYAELVGNNGCIYVFEPSSENLTYLKKNISNLPNKLNSIITIAEKGAGDTNEVLDFYLDPITGQNNSFVKDFDGFYVNRKNSADININLEKIQVEVIRLDDYFSNIDILPDFVKIDVEGFELNVVNGFKSIIQKKRPNIMIEIQKDEKLIVDYFLSIGYFVFNDKMNSIKTFDDYLDFKTPNIFFLNQNIINE
jgi:FkbM family methyltransferase